MINLSLEAILGVVLGGGGLFLLLQNRHLKKKYSREKEAKESAQTQANINEVALEETSKSNIQREEEKREIQQAHGPSDTIGRIIDWVRKTNSRNQDPDQ